jgi:lysyl-tRNA synthetase class 2
VYESQFEEDLYKLRREKLRQIGELGQKAGLSYAAATYPNSYATTHAIPELRVAYDPMTAEQFEADLAAGKKIEVSIAGRIMAIRVQGKAGFAQLQQAGQRMQIYVRKDDVGEDAFALYKLLDLGDHIGVRGFLFRTRTGELTVHAASINGAPPLTFLAKAMLALPDKFHGLEDMELRYRQRYVDLFMNTGRSAKQDKAVEDVASYANRFPDKPVPDIEYQTRDVREVFVKRAAILRAIRAFFDSRDYIEVETPMLQTIAGGAAARPFKTHHNALDIPLSLRIAPELYLKRLVVGGFDRVYEINRNFRNEGISTQHNPEFTMLEFYQAYSNYEHLMEFTKELIATVAKEVHGGTTLVPLWDEDGKQVDLAQGSWRKYSMREAIIKFWPPNIGGQPTMEDLATPDSFEKWFYGRAWDNIEVPDEGTDEELAAPRRLFAGKLRGFWLAQPGIIIQQSGGRRGPALIPGESAGKLIASLFEILAESHLIQPTIIYDFPLAVSPLSKIKPDEPDWVERFEFYIGGFEVGNAFSELNDPDDQRARFEAQIEERKRGDEEAMAEVDEDYVRALGYGLPPTAGEGIGIDRLTMVLTGAKSIRDVILFPLLRPQGKSAAE